MSNVNKQPKLVNRTDRNAKLGKNPLSWIVFSILLICSLYCLYKLSWALITSFKDVNEFMDNKIGLPKKWEWNNYLYVFENFYVPITDAGGTKRIWLEMLFGNSILFAGVGAFLQVATVAWVAYLTAKFEYKMSGIIHTGVIIIMVIPLASNQPAMLKLMRNLNIYDTFFSFYLMKISFTNLYYLLLFPAFKGVPKDYTEAAIIDGAGEGTIFFRVNLPMVMPMILTIFLINFIAYWNDYMTPLIYTPSHPTLSYGVYILTNTNLQGFSRTPMRMSTALLAATPMLIIFIIFRKQIMRKMSMGGLKG